MELINVLVDRDGRAGGGQGNGGGRSRWLGQAESRPGEPGGGSRPAIGSIGSTATAAADANGGVDDFRRGPLHRRRRRVVLFRRH